MRHEAEAAGVRRLFALVSELPTESSLRRKHRPDIVELFDVWARTFIDFQAGEKVWKPERVMPTSRSNGDGGTRRRNLIESLRNALGGKG